MRRPAFEHRWSEYDRSTVEQILERIEGATIVLTNKAPLRRGTLERARELQLIAIAATGTDCVDKEYCRQKGIVVSNVRGYALRSVPEHVFGLMLALRRSIVAYRDDVRRGEWQKAGQFCFFTHPVHDLYGARLGIIGEGVLGQGVAEIARGFGMKTMFAAHKGRSGLGPLYTPFDEVLETSDAITLHCPDRGDARTPRDGRVPQDEAPTRRD